MIAKNQEYWENFMESKNPFELEPLEGLIMSDMLVLCLIKILTPEKIIYGIMDFIIRNLGREFVEET